MDGGSGCPYYVLGLERTASREDVKAAFRDNAMRFHPDRDPSPQAAARFVEVRAAAESLLHGKPFAQPGSRGSSGRGAASASASHSEAWVESVLRRRGFSTLFSGLCIAGGCALFAGVMYQHIYHPMYNGRLYIPPEPSSEPRELSEQQVLMNEMLQRKLEARRSDAAGKSE
mmetsp:Transcript_27692/g.71271  ORF Transcript_27692/g.71271 Transcript_27692/m.71271 type:complete len:172 (-) Transcript_27692:289-804(-)|eukprot:jgi/Tetstr1/423110/TSEL_013880.t1